MTPRPAVGSRPSPGEPIRSVYVHAPFCARRCFYCDFAVSVSRSPRLEPWVEALAGELSALAAEGAFPLAERLDTLFVGGGTPSLLGPDAMAALAGVLGVERLSDPALEWTAEANPESFTAEVASRWRRAGLNRVSLGVQTFHEPSLRWMGRMHGSEGARRAVRTARDAGLANLSVDLIFGLPGELGRDWSRDLEAVLDLAPPHVSLYGLTVEKGTPLARAVEAGTERVADEAEYGDQYLQAADVLTAAGYVHYEVSNFALPGRESRHNRAYWTGLPYAGLGNGAHSYRHPMRRWNVRDWPAYAAAAVAGRLPVDGQESLSDAESRLERLWLGLRIRDGLETDGLSEPGRALVEGWRRRGLAEVDDGAVRLTPAGWLLLDRLAVALDEAESGAPRAGETARRD